MTESDLPNPALDAALDRLARFRAAHDADATIDAASGLTAADLDVIVAAAKPPSDLEPGGSQSLDDLANFA